MSDAEKKTHAKTEVKRVTIPHIRYENHEAVIKQFLEIAELRHKELKEQFFLDWIREKFLARVQRDHPGDENEEAIRLQRVVWNGKHKEMIQRYLGVDKNQDPDSPERARCSCLC